MLNRTDYPDSYLTITQPFINSGGQFRGACQYTDSGTHSVQPVSATEKWRNDGLFYLVRDDGTLLSQLPLQQGPPSPSPEMKRESRWYDGQKYLFVSRSIPALAPAP